MNTQQRRQCCPRAVTKELGLPGRIRVKVNLQETGSSRSARKTVAAIVVPRQPGKIVPNTQMAWSNCRLSQANASPQGCLSHFRSSARHSREQGFGSHSHVGRVRRATNERIRQNKLKSTAQAALDISNEVVERTEIEDLKNKFERLKPG